MRIIHISDIHLSSDNYDEFSRHYIKDLPEVLKQENAKKDIDIIVITGDLVDQGGNSLCQMTKFSGIDDPYEIFESQFIEPIKRELSFGNEKFLFIPGNHDIDENTIMWVDEKNLQKDEYEGKIKTLLNLTGDDADRYRARIKKFKDFEERFHKLTPSYNFTRNQSTYIYNYNASIKVGFALINDSWRCSTCKLEKYPDKKLFFGTDQLYDALDSLGSTTMNVILTHHPIDTYHEIDEVRRALTRRPYHLHLYGDQHHRDIKHHISSTGHCIALMARAGLNKPDEKVEKWQPGFHIIDIDFERAIIESITYYKYDYESTLFTTDGPAAPRDGVDRTGHALGIKPLGPNPDLTRLDQKNFIA